MKPTKLDVFSKQFDVNTPAFLKEACENCEGGMYAVCWNVFRTLLAMVAERSVELNDPIMNVLMIRLNLYEMKNEDRHKIIEQIRVEVEGEGSGARNTTNVNHV